MKNKKLIVIIVVALILIAVGLTFYFTCLKPHNAAVSAYKEVVALIEEKNAQLDSEIKKLQDLIDTPEKPLDENITAEAKEATKAAGAEKIIIGEMPSKTSDIIERTNELSKPVDYSEKISALQEAYTKLDNSKKQYKQLTNPSEDFVLKRLLTVDEIVDARAATEEQDPNGQLHKAGGYTSAVFFESSNVDQSSIYVSGQYSDVLIDKGTDAGGCIEVYETEEDANKRNDYLASFDGGIFSSGSHRVAGTVVIRTSDSLSASKQKELEQKVFDALTRLE